MKAVIWTGTEAMELGSVPDPTPAEGEVLIKVEATGICGTDLTIFHGKFPRERAIPPMVLGHEFAGTVEETGRNVKGFKKGDPVVVDPLISCGRCFACTEGFPHLCSTLKLLGIDIDGSFATHVTASAARTYHRPPRLGIIEGALVEPLSVAVHAVRRSDLRIGDSVLVTGGGPIGILIALAARCAGARGLFVTEINKHRLEILHQLGLHCCNPQECEIREVVKRQFDGIGPDVVFEATGTSAGMQQALRCVRTRGTIAQVGLPKGETCNDTRDVLFGEISTMGMRVYEPGDILTSIDLLERRKIDVKRLVSTFNLDECPRVFKRLTTGESGLIKAVLIVNEEHLSGDH
jgi:2-desacetyl-2-hydroxyethyl bacteriochlorophyllide A dehydrogenase